MSRPQWLTPPARPVPVDYWSGYSDAVADLRKQLDGAIEHVQFRAIAASEERVRPADRSAVEVAGDCLRTMLDDIHRGNHEVRDQAMLLIDCDPEAAAEAMQPLCWLFTDRWHDFIKPQHDAYHGAQDAD